MAIITTNSIVVKNSIGDFTIPHPKGEEKYDGSDSGPLIKLEGKSNRKISARKIVK